MRRRSGRRPVRSAVLIILGCTAIATVGIAEVTTWQRAVPVAPAVASLLLAAALLAGERVVTNRRHRRQVADATRLAHTDDLSGLANRRALLADLEDALAADGPIGLALIDLDRFKTVNDTHGHAAGDHVLQVVATRLREVMTPGCLVARLGGDEFAVLTFDDDPGTLPVLASRVRGALARPVPVAPGRQVTVGTSIGTATRAGATVTATDLLRRADTALYRAKTARPTPTPVGPPRAELTEPPRFARAAAESLAELNQDVAHGHGYLCPSQVHATIGHLWLLTHHLTASITQASRWLDEQHRAGRARQPAAPDATDLTGHPFGRGPAERDRRCGPPPSSP
jgi:diguanylate cyclase (GGDEF)-like protein